MQWLNETMSYWQSGGILLIPIGLVSFALWLCFARSRQTLSRILRDGHEVENAWDTGDMGGDAETISRSLARFPSGMAEMLRLALRDITQGAPPQSAFAAREEQCIRILRRDFVVLASLTAVAPLLGLLGTVIGMIETFDAVAALAGNTGGKIASGISRALITTQFGLVVALPGVFGLARLRRMLREVEVLMAECRVHAIDALR